MRYFKGLGRTFRLSYRAGRSFCATGVMRWIDPIHRWTGAIIGVLLAAMGLSGTLLIHEDAWVRATVPHAFGRACGRCHRLWTPRWNG